MSHDYTTQLMTCVGARSTQYIERSVFTRCDLPHVLGKFAVATFALGKTLEWLFTSPHTKLRVYWLQVNALLSFTGGLMLRAYFWIMGDQQNSILQCNLPH